MKIPCSIYFAIILTLALFTLCIPASAQRARRPMVTAMQASIDKDGPHPDKKEIKEPAPITCLGGVSDDPGSPVVACKITGPGFNGILKKGEKADLTDAGTVTLACTGRGWVRCNARIN